MKRNIAIALVGLAGLITTGGAFAQNNSAQGYVPFAFSVSNTTLPAGHYSVTAEETIPSVLFFRSADGLHTAIVDTEWGTSRLAATPTLRFAVYGTTHFLTGVRMAGESMRMVPVTRRDVTLELARLDRDRAMANGE